MPTLVPPTVAQVLVILVPCYAVAYATDKVVYVVPTLAAAPVLSRALTLKLSSVLRPVLLRPF